MLLRVEPAQRVEEPSVGSSVAHDGEYRTRATGVARELPAQAARRHGTVGPMSTDAARTVDPEFPNLRPEVVAAWRAADEHDCVEVVDGELVALPRPRATHATSAIDLASSLHLPFRRGQGGPGGWIILPEPELRLGARPDVVVPDLAGWRRERMPELPDVAHFTLAPDWVCEVLSPSTEAYDRGRKLRVYRREGITHVWFVDPAERILEVFRLTGDLYALVDTWSDGDRVRAEPFDAIELDLAQLWAR